MNKSCDACEYYDVLPNRLPCLICSTPKKPYWVERARRVPTIPIARLDAWLQRRNQFVEELYTPIDITMDWEGASVITNEYADGVLGVLQDLIDLLNEECKP